MKQTILIFLFGLCLPLSLLGQKIKTCPLDTRPFTERLVDFMSIRTYESRFTETNSRHGCDKIEYKGWRISVNYSPLSDFIGISKLLVQDNAPFGQQMRAKNPKRIFSIVRNSSFKGQTSHLCQRDFVATWEIRDNKIYLKNIKLFTPDMEYYSYRRKGGDPFIYPDSINPSRKEVIKRVEQATGRKFSKKEGIFADWFSGELCGEASLYAPNIDAPDREAFSIRIRNGVVEEIRQKKMDCSSNDYYPLFFVEAAQALSQPDNVATPIDSTLLSSAHFITGRDSSFLMRANALLGPPNNSWAISLEFNLDKPFIGNRSNLRSLLIHQIYHPKHMTSNKEWYREYNAYRKQTSDPDFKNTDESFRRQVRDWWLNEYVEKLNTPFSQIPVEVRNFINECCGITDKK